MTGPDVPAEFAAFADTLADAARPIVSKYFRTAVDIIDKSDESPVTVADREAEAAIRALIEETYPDHGIFGEEYGTVREDSRYVWVLDPIDGTRAFITGLPIFGTLIALADNGVPVLGILDQPILKERWLGVLGRGTTYNGMPVTTRSRDRLADASMYFTTPEMLTTDGRTAAFQSLYDAVKEPRYGGDCYSSGLVASGFVDIHVDCELKPYDYMALAPIIQAAGGIASTWRGEPITMTSGDTFLGAGCGPVHRAAVDLLSPGQ